MHKTSSLKPKRSKKIQSLVSALATSALDKIKTSGIAKSYKRLKGKTINSFEAHQAEVVILVGTEKGSTARFASAVFDQLLVAGVPVYINDMNRYETYLSAKHLLFFCSTYGDGEAPKTATRFKKRLKETAQPNDIQFSVVGFGASSYKKYCAYAIKTQKRLSKQPWATSIVPLHTVNKRSADEFAVWAQAWSDASGYSLSTNPDIYRICTSKKK